MRFVGKYLLPLLVMSSFGASQVSAQTLGSMDSAATFIGEPITIDVLTNDDGQNLTIKSVNESSVGWGRVAISDDKKSLTYTPHASYTGHDEFWYVLESSFGDTGAAKVIVNVSDREWPVATSDTVSATYNEIISIPVLSNDIGVELKIVSVNEGSTNQGKVQLDDNGVVKYQQLGEPRGNQTDEFWYLFEDKWGRKNAAKVTVNLSETNNEAWPVAVTDKAKAENGLRVLIPVLENDTGTGLLLKSTNAWSKNGGKSVIVNDLIRYTPPRDFTGTDEFWYVFEDNQGRTNSARVEVDVTQNTQLSVVKYCGTTYETDGSFENTVSTLSSETPTGPKYLALTRDDFIGSGAIVDGRRYYREALAVESGGYATTLWMDVSGVKTKVVEGETGESIYPIGAFDKYFYYSRGNQLFAHDGGIATELTKFIEGEAPLSEEASNYSITSEAYGSALYLRTISGTSGPQVAKNSYWRISDGKGLQLSFIGSSISAFTDSFNPDYVSRVVIDKAYFNGVDYAGYELTVGNETPPTTQSFEITQQGTDQLPVVVEGKLSRFIENNGRFFVATESYYDRAGEQLILNIGKLYVVDNKNDSFIELATCTEVN